jgi:hypothetical protein
MVNVEKYIKKKMFEYFYLFVVYSRQIYLWKLLFIRGNIFLIVSIR